MKLLRDSRLFFMTILCSRWQLIPIWKWRNGSCDGSLTCSRWHNLLAVSVLCPGSSKTGVSTPFSISHCWTFIQWTCYHCYVPPLSMPFRTQAMHVSFLVPHSTLSRLWLCLSQGSFNCREQNSSWTCINKTGTFLAGCSNISEPTWK